MKRLVHTSGEWIELDVNQIQIAGLGVRATVFPDEGWAAAEESWNAKYSEGKSLERFVAEIAGIPEPEASEIVRESLREWRERGGEKEERGEKRKMIAMLTSTFGLAAIGALALLVLLALAVRKLA